MARLTEAEVANLLSEHPAWTLVNGALTHEETFSDFAAAMIFVNHVATLAEEADHHPDIDIRYNKVRLTLISHDVNGLTNRDARMAARLSREF